MERILSELVNSRRLDPLSGWHIVRNWRWMELSEMPVDEMYGTFSQDLLDGRTAALSPELPPAEGDPAAPLDVSTSGFTLKDPTGDDVAAMLAAAVKVPDLGRVARITLGDPGLSFDITNNMKR